MLSPYMKGIHCNNLWQPVWDLETLLPEKKKRGTKANQGGKEPFVDWENDFKNLQETDWARNDMYIHYKKAYDTSPIPCSWLMKCMFGVAENM